VIDVFLVGTVFFDLVLAGIEELPEPGAEAWARARTVSPGGVANRAVAAARLGLHTGLAGALGDDFFGRHLWRELSDVDNLDLGWSRLDPDAPTAVTVSVTHGQDRRFLSHGNLIPPDVPNPPAARATHLPVGVEVPKWARDMRAAGTTVFGGVGWDPDQVWSSEILTSLGHFDAFTPNESEAIAYARTDSAYDAAKLLAEHVPLVAVTRGADGSIAIDSATGEYVTAPPIAADAVDPTGAGDEFAASFIYGTLAGWPLRQRLLFGNLCAGLSVQRLGGAISVPTWADIRAWLAANSAPEYGFLGEWIRSRRT
jgi:sugar/nucleoside kinase (ribokinase family)